MPSEGDLGISAQTILELPIESLALAVLKNYDSTNAWNRRNWLLEAERTLGRGPHLQALAEAWSWLEARTLVTHTATNPSSDARSLTRAGKQAIAADSLKEILAAERIALDLHPRLHGKIRPIFLLGDYETAAFKAMKEVEVRVRELSGLANELIGVQLMRQAFNPTSGSLTDMSHEGGERQAPLGFFRGSYWKFQEPDKPSNRHIYRSD